VRIDVGQLEGLGKVPILNRLPPAREQLSMSLNRKPGQRSGQ
jgi:hypothetical protein